MSEAELSRLRAAARRAHRAEAAADAGGGGVAAMQSPASARPQRHRAVSGPHFVGGIDTDRPLNQKRLPTAEWHARRRAAMEQPVSR